MIYLDNNATTNMPIQVCKEVVNHFNMGNPSASHRSAKKAQKIMHDFRQEIAKICEFSADCSGQIAPNQYEIIFTSGASEANSMIITRVIDSYLMSGRIPHIIISAYEHKSILDAVKYHRDIRRCASTLITPAPTGHIIPETIESAIRPDTALVCVMHANNEIGACNNISEIGKIAHKHNVRLGNTV
jgi:cysteine desulfurase